MSFIASTRSWALICRLGSAALALLVAGSLGAAGALAAEGPASVSSLAERLTDSVVNISTTQNGDSESRPDDDDSKPDGEEPRQMPDVPPGAPFEEFFNEFFKNRNGQRGNPSRPRKTSSLGSGFVIDAAGIIVTNNHVIDGADEVEVNFNDGTKLKAEIVGRDKKVDLAVLKVTPKKPLTAAKFGDSDKIKVGDWVLAIGNPFGLGGTVTLGIVSARNRDINSGPYDNYIQTDAAINRGNSGGPLFNMDGEVVGINTAIISPTGGSIGIGFSVPSATAGPIIEQLRQYGETRRGWLGVRIQAVTDDIAESLGMEEAKGALIAGVDENGPAKPAGLEPGDVVIKFDGKAIREMRDLPRRVADTPVDKNVEIVILRKGQELTKTVKIARLDESEKDKQAEADKKPESDAKSQAQKALGLEMSPLTQALRAKYKIGSAVKGVVITAVEDGSSAAEKQMQPGDVIVEVSQIAVEAPGDVAKRIEALKKDGKKSALLLLSNGQGELRFVAVALD